MDREEIFLKMKELRENLDLKFLNEEMEEKKETFKKVQNVKYLGNVEIDEETIQIFLIFVQEMDKDGRAISEICNCYTEDGNLIGRFVSQYDIIAIREEYTEIDGLYEKVNMLDKNGELDLNKIEKAELENIAKALGMKEEEIQAMSSMELAQKIEEKQEAKENNENEQDEENQLDKEQTKNITDGKREISLSTRVDEYKTLGQVLDLNESEYSKVAIVYSEKLKEIQDENQPINNTAYSFVAIKKDGTAEVINDRLKVDERSGNNSFKDAIKVDADETARKDDKTKTRFQIIGKNGEKEGRPYNELETLSVENGQYGEIKAYYGKGTTRDGKLNIETQLATDKMMPTSIELRKLQSDRKGIYNNDQMAKEANESFEKGDEEINIDTVDGDPNTVNLTDYIEKNKELIIEEVMAEIEDTQFGESDVINELDKVIEKDDKTTYTQEEINQKIDEIKKEIVRDAENFPTRYK